MNNETILNSVAEQKALKALQYDFCSKINLESIKRFVQSTLSQIGREGMFNEYTMHDITHVNGVLNLLDKIIPQETKDIMTDADWLMIVLAVYFHDLGMYVPREEYLNREKDDKFIQYKSDKIEKESIRLYLTTLSSDDQEHFLYQEYVRQSHGDRVCEWIKNCNAKDGEPYQLINENIGLLDEYFRKTLADICRSHQLNELPVSLQSVDESFGPTSQEKVNLLYVSVLLRSADLLHITRDRTPMTEYRLINPRNEVSKIEWLKQQAVRSIDIKKERKNDGTIDTEKQSHVFEIQAEFSNAESYFSFMDYVKYAIQELEKCHAWCEESILKNKNGYIFPWDDLDTTRVDAKGFCKEKLHFDIDQESILTLLTGQTLYNDSTVVLRELIQNAIDAGKAQHASEKSGTSYKSHIDVIWNSNTRELTVSDNGSGMTEADIKNYLLRVGASKYQSETFRKDHPNFNSISRFGIGLLTCFMISDDVDVYTLANNTKQCLHLMIRKLNGEYLMRNDEDASNIYEQRHGTKFILKVRPDIEMANLASQIQQWIIIPFGEIILHVDKEQPISIGYTSTENVIRAFCDKMEDVKIDDERYRISTMQDLDVGMTMSCLQSKNPFTQTWSICTMRDHERKKMISSGICIEGIRVTNSVPGVNGDEALVIVNCVGRLAPKTNVARNDIESGETLDRLYKSIYRQYMQVFLNQIEPLHQGHSKIWVLSEINYQIDSFCSSMQRANMFKRDILKSTLMNIECVGLDNGNEVEIKSFDCLPEMFYTIDSMAYISSVNLLKEVMRSSKTPVALLAELTGESFDGLPVLFDKGLSRYIVRIFQENYEPDFIVVNDAQRSIKIRWRKNVHAWYRVETNRRYYRYHEFINKVIYVFKNENVSEFITGTDPSKIICTEDRIFVLPGSALYKLLIEKVLVENYNKKDIDDLFYVIKDCLWNQEINMDDINRLFEEDELSIGGKNVVVTKGEFVSALKASMKDILSYRYYYHNE